MLIVQSLLLLAVGLFAGAQKTHRCAGDLGPSRVIITSNGDRFGVCLNSDFRHGGNAYKPVGGINTVDELAENCSKLAGCLGASQNRRYNVGWPMKVLDAGFLTVGVDSVYRLQDQASSSSSTKNTNSGAGSTTSGSNISRRSASPDAKAISGQWGDIIKFPVVPVGIFLVSGKPKTTRLLAFSAFSATNFGGQHGYTQFAEYNLETGVVSQRTISNTMHDMFCPGISALQDGRVVITGGSNAERTSIYDANTNNFISGPNMQLARGYQSSVTLSNGKIFTIGGSWSGPVGNKNGEIYDPATNTWTSLPNALVQGALTQDNAVDKRDVHQWLFGWRDGSIFQAGPSQKMNWFSASGSGSVTPAGTRSTEDAMCGVFVMYDALRGKILTAAGTPSYDNSAPNKKANLITIGAVGAAPVVEPLPDLAWPRAFPNAVILPDATVIILGGQLYSKSFTDEQSILIPELFDPSTKTFRQLAPMKVPRNYHATSILLPDGRVFAGGGGLCYTGQTCGAEHLDAEIYSPPYLFNSDGNAAPRPTIVSLSSDSAATGYSVRVGGVLTVILAAEQTGVKFSFMRVGTNTHSVNTDQRRVPLESIQQKGTQYTLTLPNDSGILIPGDWFLFAISAQGAPSVARTVSVQI